VKAVIMAGGEGTRLRPLTSLLPKPMVPVANQPVMEHIVGLVKHHGMNEIVATLAFMPRAIRDYFGDGEEWAVSLTYAVEDSPLGTAGSVKNAEAVLRDSDEPFLVISGDALTDIDLADLVRFHREKGGAVTIALKQVPDPLEYGVVITAEDGRIERFLEKPTWGQVFSDTINTGIYVIEPWVLDEIPAGTVYDFSAELFPKLMDAGHSLFGYIAEGYWCDVGSRESYMSVHRDVLSGEAMVYKPGIEGREGLWVGEGAVIDPTATLGHRVIIGKNVTVRAGAVIGDDTVIGDNSVIGIDARVSHSVLWDDVFVGRQAEVDGAVLCRRVDVRANAKIDVGAVVGDETMVGHGGHIGANVQVFPYKRIEPGAFVNSSLIWESVGARSLFGEMGISGLVGVDITPELAMKVAEAFGSLLVKGGHVVCSRDTSRAARMVKRAIIAGLNSSGINVRDLRVAPPGLTRFTTQKTRCVGGIHIASVEGDLTSLQIQFFDRDGLDIAPWEEKKVERLYFRGEFRRAFFDEIGDIIYPPRPLEYYTAALQEAVAAHDLGDVWRNVVVDFGGGTASFILPQVAQGWHINLVTLNGIVDSEAPRADTGAGTPSWGQIAQSVDLFNADLGVRFDANGERIVLMTPSGTVLDGDVALHALVDLWCRVDNSDKAIAVPLQASSAVERIAEKYGRTVIRPGRSRRALAAAVVDGRAGFAGSTRGGYIYADFLPAYDGALALAMLVRMLAKLETDLDEVVAGLPTFHKRTLEVFCPADRKGAVMRTVTEASAGHDADLTEGVRVHWDHGWVLVLPHGSEPLVHIVAEGEDAASVVRIAEEWRELVESAVRG